jgi:hypothetical protein
MECVRRAWSEIKLALEHEEPLKSIHSRLADTGIPADYHTFATYVNRLRKEEETQRAGDDTPIIDEGGRPPGSTVEVNFEIGAETGDAVRRLTSPAERTPIDLNIDRGRAGVSPRPTVHLFLQGTDGIGKSAIASILVQYLLDRRCNVKCIDADPTNHTLSQYKGLEVEFLGLTHQGVVNTERLDFLVNTILKAKDSTVADCWTSTFATIRDHFQETNFFELLTAAAKQGYMHIIIPGGPAQDDALEEFRQMAETTPSRNIVVWVNESFEPVECDGKTFVDSALYLNNEAKISGLISIPLRCPDTFGRDMNLMICRKQTFREAIQAEGPTFSMTKHRLGMMQRELFKQLDIVWPTSMAGAA